MNRSIAQVRLIVATLMLSLTMALGIGSVIAAPSPYFEPGSYQAASDAGPDSAIEIDRLCNERECTVHPADCCSAMLSQSCGGLSGFAVLTITPATTVDFVRPVWASMPANALAGTDPRVTHRPPRVSA
jgi:hypothetical protein